jgi:GDPmannose 4,6-dehydratase
MAVALILGVNGQAGSYLAESLLRRGHTVVGIANAPAARHAYGDGFRFVSLDLKDSAALSALLGRLMPDVVFHMAAVHGAVGAGFIYEPVWRDLMQVNVFALHVLLEHARLVNRRLRIMYAGSAKVFPQPWSGVINEATPMRATCLYGVSKLAARDLMSDYRRRHGIMCTNLVLFNFDSPRRGSQFLLPQLASALRASDNKRPRPVSVKNLNFHIDWSAADEIMDQITDLAFGPHLGEVVVASGRTVHARAALQEAFRRHGHDLFDHVVETDSAAGPSPDFRVDIGAFAAAAGRRPTKTIYDILDEIVASEP